MVSEGTTSSPGLFCNYDTDKKDLCKPDIAQHLIERRSRHGELKKKIFNTNGEG